MKKNKTAIGIFLLAIGAGYCSPGLAADAPVANPAIPDVKPPEIPAPAAGVYSVQKKSDDRFHLSVTGHTFTSRDAIEQYLAYRAAELTKEQHANWFSFVEQHAKADRIHSPKPDPMGPRFSFRMQYWRPVWRYKVQNSPGWKSWSPYSGAPFFGDISKDVTVYEVSADILLHKGSVDGINPLAFDADALSDFLVNQVSPPQ